MLYKLLTVNTQDRIYKDVSFGALPMKEKLFYQFRFMTIHFQILVYIH